MRYLNDEHHDSSKRIFDPSRIAHFVDYQSARVREMDKSYNDQQSRTLVVIKPVVYPQSPDFFKDFYEYFQLVFNL